MDPKAFVLCNVPECSPQLLQDYVEATVDLDVSQVKIHPDIPDRALILLGDEMEDMASAQQAISTELLNNQKVQLLPIQQMICTLYVSNMDPNILSGETLQLYLMSVFADGEDVITTCLLSEDKKTAVVFFQENQVVERILSAGEYVPLPSYSESYHIRIEACYSNFHDKIRIVKEAIEVGKKAQIQNLPVCDRFGQTANDNNSGNASGYNVKDSCESQKIDSFGDDLHFNETHSRAKQMFSDTDGGASKRGGQQHWRRQRGRGRKSKQNERNRMRQNDFLKDLGQSGMPMDKIQQPANVFPLCEGQKFPVQNASHKSFIFPVAGAGVQTTSEFPTFSQAHKCNEKQAAAEENERRKRADSDQFALEKRKERRAQEAELQRLREENERLKSRPQQTTEEVRVSPLQGKLLSTYLSSLSDCRARYNSAESAVLLSGVEEKVMEVKIAVLELLQCIKEECMDISLGIQNILKTEKGTRYLNNLVQTQLTEVQIFVRDTSIQIAAFKKECLEEAKKVLKKKLNKTSAIECKEHIPEDKRKYFNLDMEKEILVCISWDDQKNVITVEGIEDDIAIAERSIRELLEEYCIVRKKFQVIGIEAAFFSKHMCADVRELLKSTEITDWTAIHSKFEVIFKIAKKEATKIMEKLTEMESRVSVYRCILKDLFPKQEDCMLFLLGLKEKKDGLEKEHRCSFSFPKLEITGQNKQDSNPAQKRKSPRANAARAKSSHDFAKGSSPKIDVDAGSGFRLVIKSYGNIVHENADVLVCIVGPKVDLRGTRVGQAFNKASSGLWKKLAAERKVDPQTSVLVTKGPFTSLKCQAICHVILQPWDPQSSAAELKNALDTVFAQCSQLQAKSVSFPAVGCGRAFKFPTDHVCLQMLSTFQGFVQANPNSSLKKVTILAADSELFTAFQKGVAQFFPPSSLPSVGAVGGVQPKNDSGDEDVSDEESESSEDSDGEEERQAQLQFQRRVPSSGEIVLVGIQRLDTLWEQVKKNVQEEYLHTEYFNQTLVNNFHKALRYKIVQEAKQNDVWVERSMNPKTKKLGYIIKGKKQKVKEMKHFIDKEFHEFAKDVPRKRLNSDGAPKRGTVEFLSYAAESDELFPSYWKLGQSKSPLSLRDAGNKIKEVFSSKKKKKFVVDVDDKTKTAISNLVRNTWEQNKVGKGQDAAGLGHTNIVIQKVERIENPTIFESYFHKRRQLFVAAATSGHLCPDIGKIPSSKGPVLTAAHMDPLLKKELYTEVNEHYLLHGTKKDMLEAIVVHGLDAKVSNNKAMFGKGVYGAESSTKSDQYADSRDSRTTNGTELKLIVMRMLLGNVFVVDSNHPSVASKNSEKLHRPPCTKCLKDRCSCGAILFDSVLGDGNWIFREFVVYDSDRCYPEYIVTYKRV